MANRKINEFPIEGVNNTDLHLIADATTGAVSTITHQNLFLNLASIEVSATFAAISASTSRRLVYVSADETNNGDISLYIHNGTTLKFLQTIA